MTRPGGSNFASHNPTASQSSASLSSASSRSYFLMKCEPDDMSLEQFARLPDRTSPWDGVRNVQARNIMREMKQGDLAFFYISNVKKVTTLLVHWL